MKDSGKNGGSKKIWPVVIRIKDSNGEVTDHELDITNSHPVSDLQALFDRKSRQGWNMVGGWVVDKMNVGFMWLRKKKEK